MKKNKKGFTLVELIATIAIISIVLLIGIRSLGSIRSKTLGKQYDVLVKNLYASGKKYYSKTGEPIVFIEDLVTDGFYTADGDIKDPVNNNVMNTMFLNAAEDKGEIYYCDGSSCNNVYSHGVVCDGTTNCIKDVYAYGASITIGIETTTSGITISNGDWTNENVILKANGFLDVMVEGGSKFQQYYSNIECTWYSKSNPNSSIGNNCDQIVINVDDNKVFEETYILYVNARVDNTVKSQYGDTVAFTAEADVKIDKIPPIITSSPFCKNKLNGTTVVHELDSELSASDTGSGIDPSDYQYYMDLSGNYQRVDSNDINNKNLYVKDKAGNFSINYIYIDCPEIVCTYYDCNSNAITSNPSSCSHSTPKGFDYDDAVDWAGNAKAILEGQGYSNVYYDISDEQYETDTNGYITTCSREIKFSFDELKYNVKYYFNSTSNCNSASDHIEQTTRTNTNYVVKTPESAFGNSGPAQYRALFCFNYDFVYWENKNNSSQVYKEGDVINFVNDNPTMNGNTLELKAIWVKPKDKCTLKFNTDGGGTINSVEGIKNSEIDLRNFGVPSKTGYVFDYWKDKRGKTYKATDNYKFYANLVKWSCDDTLTAIYKKTNYTVKYDLNGGSSNGNNFSSQAKITGTALNLYSYVPTKTGYDFDVWCTSKLCWSLFGAKKYSSGSQYTEDKDVTLYAQWNKKKAYKVKYECGGTGCNGVPSDQSFYSGESVIISSSIPSRSGYIFTGWKSSDGLEYFGGEEYSNTKNLTLTAKWYKTTFSVTYVDLLLTNAGSNSYDKGTCATIKHGRDSLTGKYKFLYWTDSSLNYYFGGEQYCSDTDLTLTAVYEKVKYTVTYFDWSLFACPLCITIPENHDIGTGFTIKNKPIMISSGYEFTGYYVDGVSKRNPGEYVDYKGKLDVIVFASYNGTETTQSSSAIKGDVENYDDSQTETIEQLEQKAKITYMNEGSVYTTQYVASGSYTTAPKGPSKANNKFNVWNCNSQSVSAGSSFYVSGDMTCYAQFVPDYCIYDKNHGDGTIGYSYPLFEYNSSTGFGNSIPPNDAQCYSGNGATLSASYKAAYERKCNTSLCSTMGISGWTADMVNSTYGCNYHRWWCVKS